MKRRAKTRLFRAIRFVILLLILLVFFLPLVSMFVTSIKTRGELYVYPPNLLPEKAHLSLPCSIRSAYLFRSAYL